MPRVRRKKVEEEPVVPAPEGEPEGEPEAEPRLAPRVEHDESQRYESEPEADTFAIGQSAFCALRDFLLASENRSDYSLSLFRCDPDWPENRKMHRYIRGPVPLPDGPLEDAIARKHGPGAYYWRLSCRGKFVSASDLPPTLRGAPVSGFVLISDETPEEPEPVGPPPAFGSENSLLREIIHSGREDAKANVSQMAEILRANTDSFRVQMEAIAKSMSLQNEFMRHQLEAQKDDFRSRAEEKDGMWKEIVGLVRDMRGGDGERTTLDRVVEALPALTGHLKEAGLFSIRASPMLPAQHVQAGTSAVAAPVATANPPPAGGPEPLKPEERDNPVFIYISKVVSKLWQCFTAGIDSDLCAESIDRLSSDEEIEWLLSRSEAEVTGTVNSLHVRFKGGDAPADLLAYTRQVWAALKTEDAEPAAPAAADAMAGRPEADKAAEPAAPAAPAAPTASS